MSLLESADTSLLLEGRRALLPGARPAVVAGGNGAEPLLAWQPVLSAPAPGAGPGRRLGFGAP